VIPRPPHQSEPLHAALIQQVLDQLHRELLPCREGEVADYIPELAKAAPDNFAIVLATADGRVYAVGDDGRRLWECKARQDGATLSFRAQTVQPNGTCMVYEIMR